MDTINLEERTIDLIIFFFGGAGVAVVWSQVCRHAAVDAGNFVSDSRGIKIMDTKVNK
jgi:hypothetical protein